MLVLICTSLHNNLFFKFEKKRKIVKSYIKTTKLFNFDQFNLNF